MKVQGGLGGFCQILGGALESFRKYEGDELNNYPLPTLLTIPCVNQRFFKWLILIFNLERKIKFEARWRFFSTVAPVGPQRKLSRMGWSVNDFPPWDFTSKRKIGKRRFWIRFQRTLHTWRCKVRFSFEKQVCNNKQEVCLIISTVVNGIVE